MLLHEDDSMATTLFKVNTTDYSANIIADSYQVKQGDVYKTYEDANGNTHRRFIRKKVTGKFKMFFRTLTDFNSFISTIATYQSTTNFSVPVTVYDNYGGTALTINAFVDLNPTITLDGTMSEYMETFEVTIEER